MTSGPTTTSAVIVVDTDVVSELMKRSPYKRILDSVSEVPPSAVHTASVTLAEVRLGIARLPAARRRDLVAQAAGDLRLGPVDGGPG